MNKNGFIFIETVIAIVVLASSLLLLYSSFSKILQSEKVKVYYDNISYIYKTEYIKTELDNLNINNILEEASKDNTYFVVLEDFYDDLFLNHESEDEFFSNLSEDFDVNKIIIINKDKINDIKKCITCANDTNCSDNNKCKDIFSNISSDMVRYMKTISINVSSDYIIVIEYKSCNESDVCRNYYSWVGI